MITRDLRRALARAVAAAGFEAAAEPGLRPTGTPGQYAASVALALGANPAATAAALAAGLRAERWIASAEVTGPGYLTVTVTPESPRRRRGRGHGGGPRLRHQRRTRRRDRPRRHPGRPAGRPHVGKGESGTRRATDRRSRRRGGCDGRRSRRHRTESAYCPRPRVVSGPVEASARAAPGHFAESDAAGVSRTRSEDSQPGQPRWVPAAGRNPGGRGVAIAAAVSFAGRDAVTFTLARAVPGQPLRLDQEIMARRVPGKSRLCCQVRARPRRVRGALGSFLPGRRPPVLPSGRRGYGCSPREATALPGPPADPGELALLDALSWLPERVATAARRGRPDEFARYLEDLASVTIDVLSSARHPGSGPKGNRAPGSDRLTLARAARTGLAAGLGLLGVTAPDRL